MYNILYNDYVKDALHSSPQNLGEMMQSQPLKMLKNTTLQPYLFPLAQLALAAGLALSTIDNPDTAFWQGLCLGLSATLNLSLLIIKRRDKTQ